MPALRFIAGVGLAGELGAGDNSCLRGAAHEHPGLRHDARRFRRGVRRDPGKHDREAYDWRTAFMIGGVLGLLLLVAGSALPSQACSGQWKERTVSTGQFPCALFGPEALFPLSQLDSDRRPDLVFGRRS